MKEMKITLKRMNEWFGHLDSRELAVVFPSMFEKIMMSADPENCTINDFIKEAKAEWKSYTKEEKTRLYSIHN